MYPEHWEERTCEEVIGLAGEYIRWYNHSRIKQSLGWKSPVEYRTSQGLAVSETTPRKRPQPQPYIPHLLRRYDSMRADGVP